MRVVGRFENQDGLPCSVRRGTAQRSLVRRVHLNDLVSAQCTVHIEQMTFGLTHKLEPHPNARYNDILERSTLA